MESRIDPLDPLPPADAVRLLRELVGGRVDREPCAAALLVEQCVRLPAAVRVAARVATSRPASGLARLAAELAGQQRRIGLLIPGEDPRAAAGAVFAWSLRQLPAPAERAFELLGTHPGAQFDAYALAALAGCDRAEAGRRLAALAGAHLIELAGPRRYAFPDLVRAYASRLAGERPPQVPNRLCG